MSDQRQNNAGGSTLYGAPLPELEQDSLGHEPNAEDSDDNAVGLVIDISSAMGENLTPPDPVPQKQHPHRRPLRHTGGGAKSNTDVQLLFKVFGSEEKKAGQPAEPISHLIKEYDAKQPQSSRVLPPPIPPAARRKVGPTELHIPDSSVSDAELRPKKSPPRPPAPPVAVSLDPLDSIDESDILLDEDSDEKTLPPREFDDSAPTTPSRASLAGFVDREDPYEEKPSPGVSVDDLDDAHTLSKAPFLGQPSAPEEPLIESGNDFSNLEDTRIASDADIAARMALIKDYHSFSHDQRIGTGTVAFMPRSDAEEEFDDIDEEIEEQHVAPTLDPIHDDLDDVEQLNSEFLRVSPPSEASLVEEVDLSGIGIPNDADGYPLAKIFRSRFSPRSRMDSSSKYHHLSSAGLYDHSSVKFLREEISEKGYSFLGTTQSNEPIDVNMAASLEIAYGSDRQAAMRTASVMASVLRKKPKQIESLSKHFPGPIFVDPFELPFDELEPVSEHGPVLKAIAQLKMLGVNFLVRFLHHHDRLPRFYAMMLINEIVPQSSSKILVDLISDEDPDIRVHASSILLKRRSQPTFDEQVLAPLRGMLASPETSDERMRYTARFLALVLDAKSIPFAIQILERNPTPNQTTYALDLLHSVTLQRYQTAEEWEKWAKNRDFDSRFARLYWLIDALNDPNLAVREDAYEQLNPTFGDHLREYLPTYPEAVRRRVQNNLRVQFQKK